MIEYDTTTGAILCIRRISKRATYTPPAGAALLDGFAEKRRHYIDVSVDPPVVRDRAAVLARWDKVYIQADGIDRATLTGLPTVCTVLVDGVPVAVDDGTLTLGAHQPGEYAVELDDHRHERKRWVITAND